MKKEMLSTSEVAKLLGISRVAVFKQIKAGKIKAKKVGRSFVIERKDLPQVLETVLSGSKKKQIEKAVDKTIREYSKVLKLLGQE
jgi:excisionase family DNA binding protein